jgi:hypothetical protein
MGDSIAVVGGGMFGVTAAEELADYGYNVTLFEKSDQILTAASGSNHWRLHRGYHYPQSDETAEQARQTEPLFRSRYEEAVVERDDHYYAIAEDSWVSFDEYVEFMNSHNLDYENVDLDLVNNDTISETIRVNENHVNLEKLRDLCWDELKDMGVSTSLSTEITTLDELDEYDQVVLATYAHINSILPDGHELRQQYKFEICEIPMIELPDKYLGNNIIIVYGPFMSIDPWGETDYFLMGDYHQMRHHTSTGYEPEIPEKYEGLVNNGLIENPSISNFDDFKEHGEQYIPGVGGATYHGSFFTIRTILPDVEDTDARPTIVERSEDIMTVFGGKLATSVNTAEQVVDSAVDR